VHYKESEYHPAERAEHFVAGYERSFAGGIELRVEAYHKRMSEVPLKYTSFANIDEFFPEARDDLIALKIDRAEASGIELFLKYDPGRKLSYWASYVLSRAQEEVVRIDYEGRLVENLGMLPRRWDQRHTINLDLNYHLNEKWDFNAAWSYRSGWPFTNFIVKRLPRDDGTYAYYHDYGKYNDSRYPPYHRLDLRINRHYKLSRGRLNVFLHVINLYARENIDNYDHEITYQDDQTFKWIYAPETWFGITPFLGLDWEF